jgi:hypothetical protein
MNTDSIGLVVLIIAVVAVLGAAGAVCGAVSISAKVNKLGSSVD